MARKKGAEEYGIQISCNLKVLRARDNLSQEIVAKRLNVSRQTISAIEKGKYNPSLILAYKLANLFNVSIEEMFEFSL